MSEETLLDYYGRRALEYERVYQKSERQVDLVLLRDYLRQALGGHRVLELACGTGYWTAAITDSAEWVMATDASDEVLDVARAKGLDPARVLFARADAYQPPTSPGGFTAGFAAFWWSHVPKEKLAAFLDNFHAALMPGARVVFADNRFVSGSSTPISRTDDAGNTYQLRHLDDGSTHEVLKNFPTRAELLELAGRHGRHAEVVESEYFWSLSYEVNPSAPHTHIAPAAQDDAREIARVQILSWQHAYREILPARFLAELSQASRETVWRESIVKGLPELLVAKVGDEVVGFVAFGPCRDEGAGPGDGEIWAIYLAPDSWSRGIGRKLWLAARERLLAQGMHRVSLWVISTNRRAIDFYCAAGFQPDAASHKEFPLGGVTLQEVRYVNELLPSGY